MGHNYKWPSCGASSCSFFKYDADPSLVSVCQIAFWTWYFLFSGSWDDLCSSLLSCSFIFAILNLDPVSYPPGSISATFLLSCPVYLFQFHDWCWLCLKPFLFFALQPNLSCLSYYHQSISSMLDGLLLKELRRFQLGSVSDTAASTLTGVVASLEPNGYDSTMNCELSIYLFIRSFPTTVLIYNIILNAILSHKFLSPLFNPSLNVYRLPLIFLMSSLIHDIYFSPLQLSSS